MQRKRPIGKMAAGVGLMEALVGVAVFALLAVSVYSTYAKVLDVVQLSRAMTVASQLANEKIEIVRNMPYASVGVVSGIPVGVLPATENLTRGAFNFTVTTTVRNVDDPFDGTIGGTPNDLSPSDHKLVQFDLTCSNCDIMRPVKFTTFAAPKSLETASTNGALFIRVFDASGGPVQGANVHILNQEPNPDIVIDDVTDAQGWLRIVDAPPGTNVYELTITKSGYSTERTYTPGEPANPNPTNAHVSVLLQEVTQVSYSIDRVSTLNVASSSDTCAGIPDIDFNLLGSKIIGTAPDVYKYDENLTTQAGGALIMPSVEWDTYRATNIDPAYQLYGTIPLMPFTLTPNMTQQLRLVMGPNDPNVVVVAVKDLASQLPISEASVRFQGPSAFDQTLLTGRGFVRQTDWSGGPGQIDFVDPTKFFVQDLGIEFNDPAGEFKLMELLPGEYADTGELTSSTFDLGSASNFHQFQWSPAGQPAQTGAESVRFQIATNNDNLTWDFVGPDGTATTYYTASDTNFDAAHNGDRYLRYKAYLQTADPSFTPLVAEIAFTFTSDCVPPGQVAFTGLEDGDYDITITKAGYQDHVEAAVNFAQPWQEYVVSMQP